jgi:hypothetical protein
LALALLGGILAACGQPGASSGPGGATSVDGGSFHTEVAEGGVRMAAGVRVGPAEHRPGAPGLVVEYRLVNDGTAPLLVHDRVPSTLGSAALPPDLNPEHAWVFMADGRVRLSKQGFAPAPGVRFIAAPVIGARLLAPGQALSGRAWVATPLEADVPSAEFDAPRSPLGPGVREVELCVQVTPGTEGRPVASEAPVMEVPATAPAPGELHCSAPLQLPSEASVAGADSAATPVPN